MSNAQGKYVRDGIYLEQDENHPYPPTSQDHTDFAGSQKRHRQVPNKNPNRDHPKVYLGKRKHNVAVVFDDDFANDCLGAILKKRDCHSDDYQFFAADNLRAETTVPGKSPSSPLFP
ncbi:hypothetical protein LZ554_001271 [Drepanopeziza brunnea f. sp. 'monogermtubi']|nr:hypothetical protein LZ554_001271 [Drepanopeziza brunnea f. sp. 'monogermtubi']